MKKTILSCALLLSCGLALCAYNTPKGWIVAGSTPEQYDMGVDKGSGRDGANAATIKSKSASIKGFGTLMQQVSPEQYLGKRVRMSGYVKSSNVEGWAALWFRVDEAKTEKMLSFDNMYKRAVKGSTGWQHYEIVLDVPATAGNMAYGALLNGTGQIWFDDINFEIVDNSVPSTNME